MDFSSVHRSVPAVPSAASAASAENSAESREIIQAIKAVNGTELFGQDYEFQYQKDPQTQSMMVRVLNRRTRELMSEVPPQYVLSLAQQLKE